MLVKFTVVGGNASKDLAKRIAKRLKAKYVDVDTRTFPDGESKITFRHRFLKKPCGVDSSINIPPC